MFMGNHGAGMQFQSTLPAGGATAVNCVRLESIKNFNPRSPHGERLTKGVNSSSSNNFNPRSPHGERHHSQKVNKM